MQPEMNQPGQVMQPVSPQVIGSGPAPLPGQAPPPLGQVPPLPGQPLPTQQPLPGQPVQPQQPQPVQQTAKPPQMNSAQNSLLFSEMRENMIIMRDGSFRSVVRCQSINFDLMSSREREGIEFSYQNFLNSLYFPVQVLIRSRRVDIGPYIDRLLAIRRSQDNMLLNVLMDDYITFIDVLSQEANIMDKSFYIVVPYYPSGDMAAIKKQAKGLFDSFFGGSKEPVVAKIDQTTYEKAKDEIKNRVDAVMSGLFQMGVKSQQLTTRELGELFYTSYNPDTAERQPIDGLNPEDLTTTFIRKGEGDAPRGGQF